ncbi:MAG TPA: glucose-1-phosphate cytidylyltransferase [Terriglobales bacterium]|nr:glucose-1-phosphate cytidylyltransferase [Terriglobales bacterium]
MKVVVLCGGLGTRLREETEFRPKPMVEIGGRPILWHIMKMYAHYGMREFVLCLGYRGNMIKDYFLNYEAMNNDFRISLGRKSHIEFMGEHQEQDFSVTLADTGLETMTGGRLQRAARYLADEETFLLTYGDGLSNVNIEKSIAFHKRHGKIATVTAVPPISRFGILEANEQGKVERFAEKPRANGLINAGFFVFNRRIFDYLSGPECILEREPMERLARDEQLMAYRHDGFFFAMDTFREYQHLNELWNSEKTPWKVWSDANDRTKPLAAAKKAGA